MTPREERERAAAREFRIHVAQVLITAIVVLTVLYIGWINSGVRAF